MKSRSACLAFLLLLIFVSAWALMTLQGCTPVQSGQVQTAAQNGQAFLTGSPTSQPSPIVTTVEAIAPVTTPWIAIASSILGIVGLGAGVVKSWEASSAKSAIAEVVTDVKTWNQPGVPFTAKTQKIVADVAGILAAAPVPNDPVKAT